MEQHKRLHLREERSREEWGERLTKREQNKRNMAEVEKKFYGERPEILILWQMLWTLSLDGKQTNQDDVKMLASSSCDRSRKGNSWLHLRGSFLTNL